MAWPEMKGTSRKLAGKVGDGTCWSCSYTEWVGLLALTARGQGSPRRGCHSAIKRALPPLLRAHSPDGTQRCGFSPSPPQPRSACAGLSHRAHGVTATILGFLRPLWASSPDSLPFLPAPAMPSCPDRSVCWPHPCSTLSPRFRQAQGSLLLLSCWR